MPASTFLTVIDCSVDLITGDMTLFEVQLLDRSVVGPHFDYGLHRREANLRQILTQLLGTDQLIYQPRERVLEHPIVGGHYTGTTESATFLYYDQSTPAAVRDHFQDRYAMQIHSFFRDKVL